MMQVIRCKTCGNSTIEFGKTRVEVKYTKIKRACEHCNSTDEETRMDFYCSEECYYTRLRKCMERGDF